MDSGDYAAIYREILREGERLDALMRRWLGRPATPGCWSPSRIAWEGLADDIDRELARARDVLSASADSCKAKWREAVAREEAMARASLSSGLG